MQKFLEIIQRSDVLLWAFKNHLYIFVFGAVYIDRCQTERFEKQHTL